MTATRPARGLHPIAWWIWALALATAASRTTNPLLLLLILAVIGLVVAVRRGDAPWARALPYYLMLAGASIVIRVVFRALFGGGIQPSDTVLFRLPQLPLPSWFAGIHVGGPVSLQAVLGAAFEGLQLGTLLCCIGAANALANPKRALRVLPAAIYELGVAVTVCMTLAPQLVESVQRVRRARRLRADRVRGLPALRQIAIPVLEDALDRSVRLAASMDSRGYGRVGRATREQRRVTGAVLLLGMIGLSAGAYGLLGSDNPPWLGTPALLTGAALCVLGLWSGGRRVGRTAYRPDPWRLPEWLVAGSGVVSAALLVAVGHHDATGLTPSLYPLVWPTLPGIPVLAIGLAALPAVVAPPPVRRTVVTTVAPVSPRPVRAAA